MCAAIPPLRFWSIYLYLVMVFVICVLNFKVQHSDSHGCYCLRNTYAWFQASATKWKRSALFRGVTKRVAVILYRPFGTVYRNKESVRNYHCCCPERSVRNYRYSLRKFSVTHMSWSCERLRWDVINFTESDNKSTLDSTCRKD